MPSIRSSVFKYYTCIVILILLLGVIMIIYSYYTKKKLVYIIIAAPSSYQPSSYSECIKLNMRSSCNIKSVFNAEYTFFIYLTSY